MSINPPGRRMASPKSMTSELSSTSPPTETIRSPSTFTMAGRTISPASTSTYPPAAFRVVARGDEPLARRADNLDHRLLDQFDIRGPTVEHAGGLLPHLDRKAHLHDRLS